MAARRDGYVVDTHEYSSNTTPLNHDDHRVYPSGDQGGDLPDTQSSPRRTTPSGHDQGAGGPSGSTPPPHHSPHVHPLPLVYPRREDHAPSPPHHSSIVEAVDHPLSSTIDQATTTTVVSDI